MLSKVKMTFDNISKALLAMDDTLPLDLLASLRQFAPSDDEAELLRAYDGDVDALATAEQFCYHVALNSTC
jgi:hypothetical protein